MNTLIGSIFLFGAIFVVGVVAVHIGMRIERHNNSKRGGR